MKTAIEIAQDRAHYLIVNGYSNLPYSTLYERILKEEIKKDESKERKEISSTFDR